MNGRKLDKPQRPAHTWWRIISGWFSGGPTTTAPTMANTWYASCTWQTVKASGTASRRRNSDVRELNNTWPEATPCHESCATGTKPVSK